MPFWINTSTTLYLGIIRNALTLTLPIVITGAAAILINNFPMAAYQNFMISFLGPDWKIFGGYVWNGTLTVLSAVMVFAIGYSIAENHNLKHPLNSIHPVIPALVSFSSLMTMIEPAKEAFAIPYRWFGIHGLFLAIIIAMLSSGLFIVLYGMKPLRFRFYSEEANSILTGAFTSIIPGLLTVLTFAALKTLTIYIGIPDLHQLIYNFLFIPFMDMGNTLSTAVLYNFIRHLLWFMGIHGSNALEPVMTEIYVNAMKANELALAAGQPLPFIFTKTFFDSFVTIGGAGGTISLMLAFLIRRNDNGMTRITKISILPAIFNINETLLFGLPVVLNPIFLIPFIAVPIAATVISYLAILWKLVPPPMADVAWTTPALIGGYFATGSLAGSMLQLVIVIAGAAIYYPFVKIAEEVQQYKRDFNYQDLLNAASAEGEETRPTMTGRQDDVGSLARAFANDLLQSIKNKELFLEYQPQVDCRTGKIVGVEALARWQHPRIGRIPPSLFIPLAEEIGFVDEMGLWVCEESCRQLKEWQNKGLTETVMSFNVSVKQLTDHNLSHEIVRRIDKYTLKHGDIKAEVTESIGLSSDMGHNLVIQDILMNGVKIAIDDFGMGHTSLVYLKKFPVSTIKLDGSLVKDIATSNISAEIVSSISELSRSMDIELLAEFVETPEQAAVLKKLGCYIFQGYLYSKPLAPNSCEEAIRREFQTY